MNSHTPTPPMSPTPKSCGVSGIRDNFSRGTMAGFLRERIRDGSKLSFVSAYFTIYAYESLREHLDRIDHLRFLFGEPPSIQRLDPDAAECKSFLIDTLGLKLSGPLTQKKAARDCAEWIAKKVQIKSVRRAGFLHGKLYHIENGPVKEAIFGSSNFTVRGLGLAAAGNNIELNLEVDSKRDLTDVKQWFDALWDNEELVSDVKQEVLDCLARLAVDQAPEFIYFKTLFHLFEQYLADQERGGLWDEDIKLTDTQIWKALYEFQRDGTRGAINKILRHNGCVLADSVGLGKTYEALAVIKYFELRNERVLVLCPKKLRSNWDIYPAYAGSALNPFPKDRFDFTVLCHTDLNRVEGASGSVGDLSNFNWGNFNLVVIDESHNFRNDVKGKTDENGHRRLSRYERLMEDIVRSGVKTKVLLLSATPVNNDLRDLRNQLYLLTGKEDAAFQDSIGVVSLQQTLKVAQGHFTTWAKLPRALRQTKTLLEKLDSSFFKLLDELTIARSRKHIISFYPETMKKLGGFPTREKPKSVFVGEIDTKKQFPTYDELYAQISDFKLSLYNPSMFVAEQFKADYEKRIGNFTQAGRERILIAMMRVGFLKRLESSVHSFTTTVARTVSKIGDLEQRIVRFQQHQTDNPELDLGSIAPEDIEDEDLAEALEVGKRIKFKLAHLKLDDWLAALAADKKQLKVIHTQAVAVDAKRDTKLADLKAIIATKVMQPTLSKDGQANHKVLVFTAFADTAAYLYDSLLTWAREELKIHIALVTGGDDRRTTFGQPRFDHILANFSPVAKRRAELPGLPQEGGIDLLIATDCISEGQNLQDCDYLVNYDIHWNPVRIIQRFGRIDRIGSRARSVQLVNFWPTEHLDRYISLKNRVETRMALVDITATGDDALLENEELQEVVESELDFRDQQLLRLKEEVLDLEELQETISLTDFTLDDFRIELSRYLQDKREQIEQAPFGLYAVVPPAKDVPQIQPGIIFCLRQESSAEHGPTKLNPLHPYFLVYVLETGDVRYTFAQPKQILEILRHVCSGRDEPLRKLCDLFDKETKQGTDMSASDALLKKAIASIQSTFQKRVTTAMQSSRSFVIPKADAQAGERTEFELVTWLVIKK